MANVIYRKSRSRKIAELCIKNICIAHNSINGNITLVPSKLDPNILEEFVMKDYQKESDNIFDMDFGNLENDILNKLPQVNIVTLIVASTCNMRCRYCYASYGDKYKVKSNVNSVMSEKTADKVVDFLSNSKFAGLIKEPVNISFSGGEPLLSFKTISHIANKLYGSFNVTFSITTNGTLINKKVIDLFKRYNFIVYISLDGLAEIHDRIRPMINNKLSFELIVKNVKKLQENRIPYVILVTLTNIHKGYLFKSIKHLMSYLNPETIHVNPVLDPKDKSLELDTNSVKEMTEEIVNSEKIIVEEYLNDIEKNVLPWSISMMNDMVNVKKNKQFPLCTAVLGERLAINIDGSIYPCYLFIDSEDFEIGNVYDGINLDKWRKMRIELLNSIKRYHDDSVSCNGCIFKPVCSFCPYYVIKTLNNSKNKRYGCIFGEGGKIVREIQFLSGLYTYILHKNKANFQITKRRR